MTKLTDSNISKIDAIRNIFGERLVTGKSMLQRFTEEESFHRGPTPDGVFKPRNTEEVVTLIKACAHHQVPVIPYGAGTSLEGHTLALQGGVMLDMSDMSQILEVNEEDQDCICQPGARREALNNHLRHTGLFFPIDPGADASIGGMVATSASGTNAVRYGTMKENVLALEVVLADGSVIRTGTRSRKTAAGLDLNHLLIGSEGTLGVVTKVTLRLYPILEYAKSLSCSFETVKQAIDAVILIIQLGIQVSRIEFMDDVQIRACNELMGFEEPELPTLFIEFQGSEVETKDQITRATEIVKENGGKQFRWAESTDACKELWSYRHNALPAAKMTRPGCEVLITDVCVPISRLSDCIVRCCKKLKDEGMTAPIVGHVGDGNFHAFLLIDPYNADEVGKAKEVADWMTGLAIEMRGTSTGEHGIGIGKQQALIKELGSNAVQTMRIIKKALDPLNILNPGKIFN